MSRSRGLTLTAATSSRGAGGAAASNAVPAPKVSSVAGSGILAPVGLVDAELSRGVDRKISPLSSSAWRISWGVNPVKVASNFPRARAHFARRPIGSTTRPRKLRMTVVPSCPDRTGTANQVPAAHSNLGIQRCLPAAHDDVQDEVQSRQWSDSGEQLESGNPGAKRDADSNVNASPFPGRAFQPAA